MLKFGLVKTLNCLLNVICVVLRHASKMPYARATRFASAVSAFLLIQQIISVFGVERRTKATFFTQFFSLPWLTFPFNFLLGNHWGISIT